MSDLSFNQRAVLDAVCVTECPTIREIADYTRLSRSSVYTAVIALVHLGLVRQGGTGRSGEVGTLWEMGRCVFSTNPKPYEDGVVYPFRPQDFEHVELALFVHRDTFSDVSDYATALSEQTRRVAGSRAARDAAWQARVRVWELERRHRIQLALLPVSVVAFPIVNTLRWLAGMDDLDWSFYYEAA